MLVAACKRARVCDHVTVIVANAQHANVIRSMAHEIDPFGAGKLWVVTWEGVETDDRLRGLSARDIFWDHFAAERCASKCYRDIELLEAQIAGLRHKALEAENAAVRWDASL